LAQLQLDLQEGEEWQLVLQEGESSEQTGEDVQLDLFHEQTESSPEVHTDLHEVLHTDLHVDLHDLLFTEHVLVQESSQESLDLQVPEWQESLEVHE